MKSTRSGAIGNRMGHRVTIKKLEKTLKDGTKIRTHPRYSWRATYVDGGQRKQKYFKTKDAAEEWKDKREKDAFAHGTNATLSDAERSAVVETRDLLRTLGIPLRDAINFSIEYHQRAQRSCTLAELVDEAIASRKRAGRSSRHISDLRSKLGRFKNAHGKRPVATISKQEIEDWLHQLKLKPKSFNSYRTALVTLFNEAKEAGFIDSNPAAKVKTATVTESKYSVLTPTEAETLLNCSDKDILPAVAIGLFTGIRSAEIEKLDWSSVRFKGDKQNPHGVIWLEGKGAKTRRHRVIPISENLCAWLLPYAKKTGPIWPENGRKLHEAARLAAGFAAPTLVAEAKKEGEILKVWPNNALRHSFASYHLAQNEDAAALALYMGTSSSMIFNNYRSLVLTEDAATYWNIEPKSAAHIVMLPKAG